MPTAWQKTMHTLALGFYSWVVAFDTFQEAEGLLF